GFGTEAVPQVIQRVRGAARLRHRGRAAGGPVGEGTGREGTMSEGRIRAALDAGVLEVTIDRPERKNALTLAMYGQLVEALERGRDDPEVRVVLVRGA